MTNITNTNLDTIIPLDLRREAAEAIDAGEAVRYGEGEGKGADIYVLQVGSRYGLCTNGDSQWTDAASLEEAIERYETGDLRD